MEREKKPRIKSWGRLREKKEEGKSNQRSETLQGAYRSLGKRESKCLVLFETSPCPALSQIL